MDLQGLRLSPTMTGILICKVPNPHCPHPRSANRPADFLNLKFSIGPVCGLDVSFNLDRSGNFTAGLDLSKCGKSPGWYQLYS
jgi:hypothetical protein